MNLQGNFFRCRSNSGVGCVYNNRLWSCNIVYGKISLSKSQADLPPIFKKFWIPKFPKGGTCKTIFLHVQSHKEFPVLRFVEIPNMGNLHPISLPTAPHTPGVLSSQVKSCIVLPPKKNCPSISRIKIV